MIQNLIQVEVCNMFEQIKKIIIPSMTEIEFENTILCETECKNELTEVINRIKDGNDVDEILSSIKNEIEDQVFCDVIIDIINTDVKPFKETAFLRELDLESFSSLITYMFENIIIQTEQKHVIMDAMELDVQQVECISKLLYTVLEWVINKRYSYQYFEKSFNDMFRFDKYKTDFLWNLFIKNKSQLITVVLLSNIGICKDIKNQIGQWYELFSIVFNDNKNCDEE